MIRFGHYVFLSLLISGGLASAQERFAIVGATIIDGNGGTPLSNGVLVIEGDRIAAVGPRSSVEVPSDARVIDASGKFVTPGFIDTNVHLSLYGGHTPERYETLVRYNDRQEEVVLEASQLHLKVGVTTVRDSYGVLPPLIEVRDAIEQGEHVGSRMLVAGNIVGWGGPFSITFSLIGEDGLTVFQERMNELVSQGTGEDLMDMTPQELRVAINAYLDKGVDFVKFDGTIYAIEGLVELGMTPSQAIVSATKNGAIACGMLDELGTLETGKRADLLVLDADPLQDIGNIRKLHHIIKSGRMVDTDALPEKPVYYRK